MKVIQFELRDALRRLVARPTYSVLSLLVLTGGLASFLLMLSIIDAFILKPLPFPQAERLVNISFARSEDLNNIQSIPASRMQHLRTETTQFDSIAAYTAATVNLRDEVGPVRYDGAFVTHELFGLLGVKPILGRDFTAADDQPGAPMVVVLGNRLWRERFGGQEAIIGKSIFANSKPATVIGVMPPDFGFPTREQVWVPAQLELARKPGEFSYEALGLLKPAATIAGARAELEAQFAQVARESPDSVRGLVMSVAPLGERFVSLRTRAYLWLMLGAGAFVLLLACANVANLQLVQTVSRQRELAVRAALGAGRTRLVLNTLTESVALCALATGLALWLAEKGDRWIIGVFEAADEAPSYWLDPHVDLRMFGYAALCALLTALVAGLIPALRAADSGLSAQLRDGERGGQGGGFARFSRGLVIGEIALSVVLLCSAAVSAQTLRDLIRFDLGTHADPNRILTGRVALFPESFPEGKDQVAFFERVADRLRAEPGVEAATAANILPGDIGDGANIRIEGTPESDPAQFTYFGSVDARFAETYGVDLIAGRWFDARDTAESDPVVIVDQRFVDKLLGGKEALGRRVRLDAADPKSPWRSIVGVTRALHIEDVDDPRRPLVLAPMRQSPQRYVSLAVRLSVTPAAFAPQLASAVRAEDPNTPVYWVRTQQRAIEKGRVGETVLAEIFGGFGALGLLLAAAGIYGVLSFSVAQRTREIGLRRAVGASSRDVTRTVAGRSAWQVGIGLAIGLVLGVPWALLLGHQSPDGGAVDMSTFAVVVLTIVGAALIATLVPTRRALAVDPMVALRYE